MAKVKSGKLQVHSWDENTAQQWLSVSPSLSLPLGRCIILLDGPRTCSNTSLVPVSESCWSLEKKEIRKRGCGWGGSSLIIPQDSDRCFVMHCFCTRNTQPFQRHNRKSIESLWKWKLKGWAIVYRVQYTIKKSHVKNLSYLDNVDKLLMLM